MLPITLNLARLDIILIGEGAAAERRLALLDEAGAARLRVFAPAPGDAFARAAGTRLARRLPEAAEIIGARLVFITDRTASYVADIALQARTAGALVHIEDDPTRSDLAMPAVLRRGDLTIAVSTGGASPALAVRLKRALGELFGPEWRARTDEMALLRRQWRDAGADADTLKHRTEDWIDRQRWLPPSTNAQ